jgi:hypothetical protein
MPTNEQSQKKRYFQYGLWMLIVGIFFWLIGGYALGIELGGFIGIILAGAGLIVIVTNRP